MKNMEKIVKSRTSRAENEYLYRYRSRCTGTHGEKRDRGQHVPVHVEHVPVHPSSGQHVPVHVQHVLVHPSSEQPIPVQVEPIPIQVVPAAPV